MMTYYITLLLLITLLFARNETPYDPVWSQHCVWMSGLSYCNQNYLKAWNCTHCKEDFPKFDHVSILNDKYEDRGFIGIDHDFKRIVIAFRGSSNLQNWITNLQFNTEMVPFGDHPSAKVHHGFLKAASAMFPDIKSIVAQISKENPTYPVVVTGHSLGAALASLTSVELALTFPSIPIHNYGFGCPRVGNADWADLVYQQVNTHYRVTHDRDIVPHLPLEMMGYHHSALEIFYPNHTTDIFKFDTCNGSGEDPNCSLSRLIPNTKDHSFYLGFEMNCDLPPYSP